MTMLTEHKKLAERLEYFKNAKVNKTSDKDLIQKLADDYVDATEMGDESLRDKAMAGLMVKFWREIGKMQKKCTAIGHLDYGDFYAQLYRCIQAACEYKAWRNPEKKTNAQACINQLILSRGAAELLYQSNRDKNKANYCAVSLDMDLNSGSDDKEVTLMDTIADPNARAVPSPVDSIIQMYLDQGNVVEAIVVDMIANGESVKITSTPTTYTVSEINEKTGEYEDVEYHGRAYHNEFWRYKVAQLLMDLPEDYAAELKCRFRVNSDLVDAAVNTLKTAKNTKVYKYLDNTLVLLQSQKELLASLLA